MGKSKIEWTDLTINPIVGCSKCSPGCENCYAETMAKRLAAMGLEQYCKVIDIEDCDGGNEFECPGEKLLFHGWNGKTAFVPSAFDAIPKRGNKKIFVGSMTDIFHERVSFQCVDEIMAHIALNPQHTFQILTKRPERMLEYFSDPDRWIYIEGQAQKIYHKKTGEDPSEWLSVKLPLPNLWLMTTICNQEEADRNIPLLLQIPAEKRGVSIEPMLGSIKLTEKHIYKNGIRGILIPQFWRFIDNLDFIICGGESGRNARPLNPDHVISLRDQCEAAKAPFFFKQWGEYEYYRMTRKGYVYPHVYDCQLGITRLVSSSDLIIGDFVAKKVGVKKAGNRLHGEVWQQFPEVSYESN